MTGATLVGSLINLGMAITAIVFMSILIHNNSSHRLNQIEMETDALDTNITMVNNGVMEAIDCQEALLEKNDTFINCTDVGNAQCKELTDNFLASHNNLTVLTVQSLNETLQSVVESCSNRTQVLRTLIAEVAPNSNPPILLQSGSSMVTVTGATSAIMAQWELYRLNLTGTLAFDYLVLLPWSGSVATTATNPEIVYDAFPFLQLNSRFLLKPQQAKWTGMPVTSVGGNLKFYARGTGGTIQLSSALSIQ